MQAGWPFVCAVCGRQESTPWQRLCADCGEVLVLKHGTLPTVLVSEHVRGVWRYRDWLPPMAGEQRVTLGEGDTPLVRLHRWPARLGLQAVYAKLEYAGPTGSFKDRGSTVLVSAAIESGARMLVEDSSGNAGASIAAYAARAGLDCEIFAPAASPPAKLRQIAAYGARLVLVDGTREAVAQAAIEAGGREGAYYAGHNSSALFVEGMKTFAFELVEQLGEPPEHIVMPVGGGALYFGAAIGFRQLLAAGLSAGLARLHLVQSTGCAPLVAAYEAGAAASVPVQRRPTVARGIEIENAPRAAPILEELRRSRGTAIAVDDHEILAAQSELARYEGIHMEATSAAAFAGLARLAASGLIAPHERVVVPVTGSGLKDQSSPA